MINRQFTIYKKLGFSLFTVYCLLFTIAVPTLAQTPTPTPTPSPTEYTLLAPIPLQGASGGVTETTNTNEYLRGLFQLIIGIAGGLAVVMIIYGGIIKMSSDAVSGQNKANDIISNAIWGLLLAIASWLILYTINPNLIDINLNIPAQEIPENTNPVTGGGVGGGASGNGVLPGYTLTPEQVAQNTAIRSYLVAHRPPIAVHNGPCTAGGTSGCTNVVGLPEGALAGVRNLASSCMSAEGKNCSVIITGGTEGGHKTHGPNIPNIDIGKNVILNSHIREKGTKSDASCGIRSAPKYSLNGAIYTDEGSHWHVCY